ncbi:MAG: hypothetical protein IJQ81_14195 [Oscillibacter sp.]|nr:hypothetical protein [Oscillibacter sp.]
MINIQIGDRGEILNVSAEGNTAALAAQCATALSVVYAALRHALPFESEVFKTAFQRIAADDRSALWDAEEIGNQTEGFLIAEATIAGNVVTLHSHRKRVESKEY